MIADFERGNFTIAQVSFDNQNNQQLVAIEAPPKNNSTLTVSTPSGTSATLGKGAIAGIVLGALIFFAIACTTMWYLLRRRKRLHGRSERVNSAEMESISREKQDHAAAGTAPKPGLPSSNGIVEAPDTQRGQSELAAPKILGSEMEGDMGKSGPGLGWLKCL